MPYDLDAWPKQIDEWTELVEGWTAQMSEFGATLSNHTGDTTRHITAVERTLWNGKANQSALNAEAAAREAADETEARDRAAADNALQASKANKSDVYTKKETDDAIEDGIGGLVNGAPAALDTLKEVADWIADDQSGAAAMAADIAAAKTKLAGIAEGANNYTLPAATASTLGGVKVGANLTMAPDGTLSATIDSALSATSENPVQNKVVKAAVDARCSLADVTRTEDVWSFPAEVDGLLYAPSRTWVESEGDPSKGYFVLEGLSHNGTAWEANLAFLHHYDEEGGYWGVDDSYLIFGTGDADATTITLEDDTMYAGDPIVEYVVTRRTVNANGLARLADLPTKTSDLTNDSGFLTSHQTWSDVKPSGGIPKTDLSSAVQTSLGKADTALQAHQDISGKLGPYPFVTPTPSLEWGFSGTPASTGYHWDISYDAGWKLYSVSDADPEESSFTDEASGTSSDTEVEFELAGVTATLGYVATLTPFTNAQIDMTAQAMSGITEFEVAVAASPVQGTMRDCVLVIDCTSLTEGDEPTVTWGTHFHPRTDAGTDFACVAGAKNVYYISEYASGEFAVGGWTETAGGNA